MNKITFIIPTIGRKTLINTIKSLEKQTNDNWDAIIVFDGIKSNINISNPKIKILEITKKGVDKNSAGRVRNEGMEYALSLGTSKWFGFVDDDDTLSNNYVEIFNKELQSYPNIDVIIMRMNNSNLILPQLKTDDIHINYVGISFIMKANIFANGLKFIPSATEDFNYLDNMKKNNYKLMISPYITYFVGNTNNGLYNDKVIGERVLINNKETFININNNCFNLSNNDFIFLLLLFLLFLLYKS